MEEIVHRFKGTGIAWNPDTSRILVDFNLEDGAYETKNDKEIEILKKCGYEGEKIVIEVPGPPKPKKETKKETEPKVEKKTEVEKVEEPKEPSKKKSIKK
ncbi:MAG: hypothetical protein GY679_01355 [Mycoplasma sp.]|nr:hypothetical protein [Mycoplasma sp.]